jgi:1,2-diacylglycerol 3-alpha-glucosyltransferase
MRVILTSTYFFPRLGGVENSLFFMSQALIRAGHEVAIMCFDGDKTSFEKQIWDGITVYRFRFEASRFSPLSRWRLQKAASDAIIRLQKDFVPDEIWSRNAVVTSGLIQSCPNCCIRHIFPTTAWLNVEGMYSDVPKGWLRSCLFLIRKWIDSYSLAAYDRFVTNAEHLDLVVFSEMMRIQIIEETKAFENRVRVVLPGVDTTVFRPTVAESSPVGDLIDVQYVFYVGRLVAAKNVDILIEAIALVNDVYLVIVGSGENQDNLMDMALKLGIVERVLFLGSKKSDTLAPLFTMASATVLPTRIESFGQVFLESLACGTPVIGFGGGPEFRTAVSEIVESDFNGIVVNEYTPQALANAITQILNLRQIKSEEIRDWNVNYVNTRYTWNSTVTNIFAQSCRSISEAK